MPHARKRIGNKLKFFKRPNLSQSSVIFSTNINTYIFILQKLQRMTYMKITLGLGLDSKKTTITVSSIGEKTVGPKGFLSILETQCGMPTSLESPTARIIQYLSCLKAADNSNRFYSASLVVDQFNVAKTLLAWRDTWYEAGWSGKFSGSVSARLQDLAAVEAMAIDKVSLGYGQRLQLVLSALQTQSTQVEEVLLLDDLANFSPLWQSVLQQFKLVEQFVSLTGSAHNNDLSVVQNTLKQLLAENLPKDADGSIIKTILLGNDNSFVVLKAKSKALSAQVVGQCLAKAIPLCNDKSIVVLASDEGMQLDDALDIVGLPRLGFEHLSPLRPALQVLPISLDLLWAPLNVQAFLQFLTHPMGVIPSKIRFQLAKVVGSKPGIGNAEWEAKIEEILAKEQEREDFNQKHFNKLRANFKYWFSTERYLLENGLPIEVARKRILRVKQWLAQQQNVVSHDPAQTTLYALALGQAKELDAALNSLLDDGFSVIKQEQLSYLVTQLTGAGTSIVDRFAESIPDQAHWLLGTQQAASFYEPSDYVIWWDLKAESAPINYPWSGLERQQLIAQGVLLADLDKSLQLSAAQSLKPILAAQERLVLVVHETDQVHHPLWDQLSSCLKNWQEIDLEVAVLEGVELNVLSELTTSPVIPQPLASLTRWWNIGSGEFLTPREVESYSSLENLFYSPYQWVLNYKARLSAGTLQSLTDGNTLKGNLVHHLYELFFKAHSGDVKKPGFEEVPVNAWFDEHIEKLLTEEGAVLLQRGRMAEKEQFITTTRSSLHALIKQLRAANVTDVQMELKQETDFWGGKISGSIDMTVLNATGAEAVIDIKWGGTKYRRDSLKDNKHLQLVTYAFMRHKLSESKSWSSVAYFVIDKGTLLAQNTDYFPDAWVASSNDLEAASYGVIWEKMRNTYNWRREQLNQGSIELTVTDTVSNENSDPGEDALVIPKTNDSFNDFKVLMGFGGAR